MSSCVQSALPRETGSDGTASAGTNHDHVVTIINRFYHGRYLLLFNKLNGKKMDCFLMFCGISPE